MDHNPTRELAFQYVQEALSPDEKRTVFDLILTDEAFRQHLKEELELKRRMQSLRTAMEPRAKQLLLSEIVRRAKHEEQAESATAKETELPAWVVWSEWVFQMTTPRFIFLILKKLQRRCLA